MTIRKALCIMTVCALVCSMAACASKETEVKIAEDTTKAETQAQIQPETKAETKAQTQAAAPAETEAAKAGLANPMVEIKDSSEFEKQLGIKIDTNKLYNPNPKMFIIDGKVAEVTMTEENPNGEPVEYTLRATKDAGLAPTMHGINGELLDLAVKDFDISGKKVTVTEKETKDKKIQIDTWQVGDVYYSLVIKNNPSQMQIAEVMDSVWIATGVDSGK